MFNTLVDPGVYLIADSFLCDGTGAMMLLLKNMKKPVLFISEPGNYAHYNILCKKNGIKLSYLELSCNDEYGDLPMTEDPPAT